MTGKMLIVYFSFTTIYFWTLRNLNQYLVYSIVVKSEMFRPIDSTSSTLVARVILSKLE